MIHPLVAQRCRDILDKGNSRTIKVSYSIILIVQYIVLPGMKNYKSST